MNALIAAYRQRLNLPHATFIRIDHDDAMVALVYKVIQPTGEPRILKVCSRPKDYLREVYFLNYFAYTSLVPRVIQTVEPEGDIPGAILMQCLPGALLKTADLTESLCFEIGALLAQIHRNPTSGYGDLLSPETLSPDPRSYFTLKFEEGMEECASHLPQALLINAAAIMRPISLFYPQRMALASFIAISGWAISWWIKGSSKEFSIGLQRGQALHRKIFIRWSSGSRPSTLKRKSLF